ncbi:hypothetical protein [Capnocytophaga gingivalis]|uniref:hypothetical protein n=1 Tax=Capnocytophaga gingivalis TaxID=1017 RepID=UPI00403D8CB2
MVKSHTREKKLKCKKCKHLLIFGIRRSFLFLLPIEKSLYLWAYIDIKNEKNNIIALEIEAISTLYGKEARRFRKMAEESERKYHLCTKKDITTDPRYKTMRNIFTLFFK